MSFSVFHVWTVVLLSADMQNLIVNRFRCRSDAEECLRLMQRAKPDNRYTMMYIPLGDTMEPISTEWQMFTNKGNAEVDCMMKEVRTALNEHPLPKVRSMLQSKIELVSESHPEIYDSAVRDAIVWRLTKWAREANGLSEFDLSSHYWNL